MEQSVRRWPPCLHRANKMQHNVSQESFDITLKDVYSQGVISCLYRCLSKDKI